MRVHVRLMQIDLMSHEEKMLADSVGILTKNQLLYQELETNAKHSIQFFEDCVKIKRTAEVCSETELLLNGVGKSVISSDFGKMELQTKLENMSQKENLWAVQYAILSNGEVVSNFLMKWKIDKLA